MAGRKKLDPKAKDNRGGARKGTGPKPKMISMEQREVKHLMMAINKMEAETGKTLADIVLAISYGKTFQGDQIKTKERLEAIKLIWTFTMSKTSEQNINVKVDQGPQIFLPQMREDETKVRLVK